MSDLALAPPAARRFDYQRLVNALFAAFVFFGMMSVIEPSPYDFLCLLALPVWFLGGTTVHRSQVMILLLWIVFEVSGFLSLMPYWDDADARLYQLQSLYLFVTTIFFTLFFAERTLARSELCLKAFAAGSVVSALVGLAAYMNLGGIGPALTTYEGRVSGTFKDPNVFGSYLILAATYLFQIYLFGASRRTFLVLGSLLCVLLGVFVSFSRGSWGATIVSLAMMTIAGFLTADTARLRRRVATMTFTVVAIGTMSILALLANADIREFFLQRAALTQDYDEGTTGRFGNQLRAIPMLLDRPEGLGPLRFRNYFGLEPHNSYIGAFANDGWIGGFAWVWIAGASVFVGLRLMFTPSPYRRLAQVFVPSLFALLLQGFQIDIDHWRQLFLCFGAVWGLETARLRAAARGGAVAPLAPVTPRL